MRLLKRSVTSICLALLFSGSIHLNAGYPLHHIDKEFAKNASKIELVNAYIIKCDENYHLAEALENARECKTNWKDIKKGLGVGLVIGLSVSAICYIITR